MSDPRMLLFVRSAAGLTLATALVWWLWGSGRVRAARRFGYASGDVPAMAIVTWTCSVLTLAAMALGAFGLLRPLSWVVLAFAGGLLLRARSGNAHRARGAERRRDPSTPAASWLFAVGVAALVLGRFAFGLRNPPVDVDSVLYHLPMVAHWMVTGGLGAAQFEPQQIGSFYPGNVEVLSLGAAWTTGHETLMTLPGVLSLALLAFALRRLAIEAGAKPQVAEGLAFALACAPGVLQLTLGLRVENVMAAWFAVAVLFGLRARRTLARGDIETALCSVGLLVGCKATGPALGLLVAGILLVGRRPRERFAALVSCRTGLAFMLVTGGFWLVRNAIAAGNPVYPAGIHLGNWALPGLSGLSDIAYTSQFAVWRAGLAGNLTIGNLWHYFGPLLFLLVPGAVAATVALASPRRLGGHWPAIAWLTVIAVATIALAIFQPFSGANASEVAGGPLTFSADNVRFLMPALVAAVPLAALGLSALPALPVAAACALIALIGLVPRAGHLGPALLLVLVLSGAWAVRPRSRTRSRVWRTAVVMLPCALLAGAVTLAEPIRERVANRAWDEIIQRFDSVPAAVAREVRDESGGRPIAVAGAVSVWALYGRCLDGRPEYVPVSDTLARSRSLWRFAPDLRSRADAGLWMRNLKASGASFVVLVAGDGVRPVERSWCETDPNHFAPVYVTAQRAVYRVTAR